MWPGANKELKIYNGDYYLHNYWGFASFSPCCGDFGKHKLDFSSAKCLRNFLIMDMKLLYLVIWLVNFHLLQNIKVSSCVISVLINLPGSICEIWKYLVVLGCCRFVIPTADLPFPLELVHSLKCVL